MMPMTAGNNQLEIPQTTEPTAGMFVVVATWAMSSSDPREAMFRRMADEWKRQTAGFPRVRDRIAHPTYRQIINWRLDAVPFLLAELSRPDPDHWFEALTQILGTNPVPEHSRGNVREMADAWLRWGRINHWIG